MAKQKLIIVGGGISGLAAGCYALMNGFDAEILEMHTLPGGMCASWKRKGFVFDYCLHNLSGTGPKTDVRRVWEELCGMRDDEIVHPDTFVDVELPGGEVLHWYADLDRLRAHLNELAPEDSKEIDAFVRAARRLASKDLFSMPMGGFLRTLKVLPVLGTVNRFRTEKLADLAARFQSPLLRRAVPRLMYNMDGAAVPLLAMVLFSGGLSEKDLGRPMGSSLDFARRIKKRFTSLGGTIRYKCRVDKILVENGRATGVSTADGETISGDIIVSAADGYDTLYRMLDGQYLNDTIRDYYEEVVDTGPFGFVLYLGVEGTLDDIAHAHTLLLDSPVDLGGGVTQDGFHLSRFDAADGFAPEGCTALKVEADACHGYWKQLYEKDRAAYDAEKERVANNILNVLEKRIPNIRERIRVMDTCTLVTAERYTGNRFGAQAPPPIKNAAVIQRKGISRTLPGLDNFYMVSQWATGVLGVSSGALEGRRFVRQLCKQTGRSFRATTHSEG